MACGPADHPRSKLRGRLRTPRLMVALARDSRNYAASTAPTHILQSSLLRAARGGTRSRLPLRSPVTATPRLRASFSTRRRTGPRAGGDASQALAHSPDHARNPVAHGRGCVRGGIRAAQARRWRVVAAPEVSQGSVEPSDFDANPLKEPVPRRFAASPPEAQTTSSGDLLLSVGELNRAPTALRVCSPGYPSVAVSKLTDGGGSRSFAVLAGSRATGTIKGFAQEVLG